MLILYTELLESLTTANALCYQPLHHGQQEPWRLSHLPYPNLMVSGTPMRRPMLELHGITPIIHGPHRMMGNTTAPLPPETRIAITLLLRRNVPISKSGLS